MGTSTVLTIFIVTDNNIEIKTENLLPARRLDIAIVKRKKREPTK